jgi:Ser/Thr protein kinase RdoA (MazF antagonist)
MFIASLTKKWRSDRSAMLGFVEGYTHVAPLEQRHK